MRSEEILKDQILKYSVYQGLLPSAGWTNARSDRVVLDFLFLLHQGSVSRMNRIDSSFQCCIKDGSRPATYAVQTEYANHLKVLQSKVAVLNVQVKGACKGIRYV